MGTFCKTNNTWLLFFFYSVNPNTVSLQSNMYQYYFHCTPGFPDLFSEKCVRCRSYRPVEPHKMPCPQVFAEETAGHCMSFFCLMGKKCRRLLCTARSPTCIPFIFGSQRVLNAGRSAALFLSDICVWTVCNKEVTLLFFPSPPSVKRKWKSCSTSFWSVWRVDPETWYLL